MERSFYRQGENGLIKDKRNAISDLSVPYYI